jgi:hypothetical protein
MRSSTFACHGNRDPVRQFDSAPPARARPDPNPAEASRAPPIFADAPVDDYEEIWTDGSP